MLPWEIKQRDYKPPADKRFEISRDPYTHERVKWLRTFQESLAKRFEFPIGVGVFGSLSKGKELKEETLKDTDIDLHVFVLIPSIAYLVDAFRPPEWRVHPPNPDELSLEERYAHFGYCQSTIEAIIEHTPTPYTVNPRVHGFIDTEDHFRRITRGLAENNHDPLMTGNVTIHNFASVFSVDVNNSLRPIRQRVIYALMHYLTPEEQTTVWQEILKEITQFEHRVHEPIDPLLPPTLKDAEARYGSLRPGRGEEVVYLIKDYLQDGKDDFAEEELLKSQLPPAYFRREDLRAAVRERSLYLLSNGFLDHYDELRRTFDLPRPERERVLRQAILESLDYPDLFDNAGELILRYYQPLEDFYFSKKIREAFEKAASKQPNLRTQEPWKTLLERE